MPLLQKLAQNARDICVRDFDERKTAKAHQIQAELDAICVSAGILFGLEEDNALVFFDPATGNFIAYPFAHPA